MTSRPDTRWASLPPAGVAVWLIDISRERLSTGNLATLVRDMHVVGCDLQSDDLRCRPCHRRVQLTTGSWPTWPCAA